MQCFKIYLCVCFISSQFLTGKPVKGSQANSADPDQMPHNVASDQGLYCLLTEFSIKYRIKLTKQI